MSISILHDPKISRCVLYDDADERPLPGRGFTGQYEVGKAQSFLGWLLAARYSDVTADDLWHPGERDFPTLADPRSYTPAGMEKMRDQWGRECLTDGEFNDFGDALADWYTSDNSATPPPGL